MFKIKTLKWRIGMVMSISLVAIVLVSGCGAAAVPTDVGDLQSALKQAQSNLSTAQSALAAAETKIGELEAGVTPEAEFNWIFESGYPPDYTAAMNMDMFADFVEYYSEGRIAIERSHGGALGSAWEVWDKVIAGTLTYGYTYPYTSFNEKFAIAGGVGMPTSWMALEQLNQSYFNGINYRIMKEAYEDIGLHLINVYHGWPHYIFTTEKPVRTPADLAGLKIRMWDVAPGIEGLKRMGALPTMLAYGEQYTGMQTGTIDGTTHILGTAKSHSWWEVAKYINEIPWWMDFGGTAMHKEAYDALPADLQATVDRASLETDRWHAAFSQAEEAKMLDFLQEKGMTLISLSPEEIKAFTDLVDAEDLWETHIRPVIGDAWYQEWKSEVLRVKEQYG